MCAVAAATAAAEGAPITGVVAFGLCTIPWCVMGRAGVGGKSMYEGGCSSATLAAWVLVAAVGSALTSVRGSLEGRGGACADAVEEDTGLGSDIVVSEWVRKL